MILLKECIAKEFITTLLIQECIGKNFYFKNVLQMILLLEYIDYDFFF